MTLELTTARGSVVYERETERTVFSSGVQASSTRIPALLACADGSLLAFAELRAEPGDAGYITIGLRRSSDGGASWGPTVVVCDDGVNTCGNPVPVQLPGGRLLLVSTWNLAGDTEQAILDGSAEDTRRVYVQRSDDLGRSWSDPVEITEQVKRPSWRWYATGPGSVEVLPGGRILIPANHSDPAYRGDAPYRSHAFYSDDGGVNWAIGGVVGVTGTNEAQHAPLDDGRVVLYMRDQLRGGKWLAVSGDGGRVFGQSWRMPFPGPACYGGILHLGGDALLVAHHAHRSARRGLTLRPSFDGGATWGRGAVVRETSSAYADLAMLPDGQAGILFEAAGDIVFGRVRVALP
ncbi:MAG TPA: sialidase family protein [Gryllotalpicola sp.]